MSEPESTARLRKPREKPVPAGEHEEEKTPSKKKRTAVDYEDEYSPYLDVFRVLTFFLLASCGLSYLVSGGETYFWGMKNRPYYLQPAWWKMQYLGGDYGPFTVRAEAVRLVGS